MPLEYPQSKGGLIQMNGDKWMSIRNDYLKGLSFKEIGRKYGIDQRTAKKYALAETKPKYVYKRPRHKAIEDYADYINELLKEAPYSATRIKELHNTELW